MNSITRRWAKGSLLITLLAVVLAEAVFIYFTVNTSYENARRVVQQRASTLINQISASASDTDQARSAVLRRMLEQFEEKERYEAMLVTYEGTIAASSNGYVPLGSIAGQDYMLAVLSEVGMGEAFYRTEQNERVLAVTAMLPTPADNVVALRLVTSMTLLDESIVSTVFLAVLLGVLVVMVSLWSGMFFVRSIVRPIGEIQHTAAKMAEGNLDIRIENQYNDEIGELSDTINHMAAELDKTERMKNEFISSVSHELRTPLTSIKGWIETIANLPNTSDPSYRRGLAVISGETDRLYDMVEELLDFSRMQNGLTLHLSLTDLTAEVSDSVLTAQQRMHHEGIALEYDEPELPIPVMADPARLRQVFLNILDNAAKYSPHGGTIRVEILSDGHSAFVNISDEGVGISPEDLENVKVKFFKGKGAVRGSGIGLAVVDEIVAAHGGFVDIQSKIGQGTTVVVRLPLHKKTPTA